MKDIQTLVHDSKQSLPHASDDAIAQLVAAQLAALTQRTFNGKVVEDKTVSQLIAEERESILRREKNRPHAKLREDGTQRLRDTTTLRTYESHWTHFEKLCGHLSITEVTPEHVQELIDCARTTARAYHKKRNAKRTARGLSSLKASGESAVNSRLNAIAVIFTRAMNQRILDESFIRDINRNKDAAVLRFALTPSEIDEIMQCALSGGDDPILDHLLLWTLLETAARTSGILHIRLYDIDVERQLITFSEKRGSQRYQPVTRELAESLVSFAQERGARSGEDAVFRFKERSRSSLQPVTYRRFETLWNRIHCELRWTDERCVTSHVMRHTTVTYVDRIAGPTVASKYAGHRLTTTTAHYTKVDLPEICQAHEALFSRKHPLAV